jgi:hypothetical protein
MNKALAAKDPLLRRWLPDRGGRRLGVAGWRAGTHKALGLDPAVQERSGGGAMRQFSAAGS